MLFRFLSIADIQFSAKKLSKGSYTTAETLFTTSHKELINKKEFANIALDQNFESFIIHAIALKSTVIIDMMIDSFWIIQTANLLQDKALTKVPAKYSDYINIFFFDLVIKLLENIKMNEQAIKLIDNKQPFYELIYTLSPVELETLKTQIEIYLKIEFI